VITRAFLEALFDSIDARTEQISTCLVGRVESYDSATQTADVRPAQRRPVRDSEGGFVLEALPLLRAVPVCFPRAGGFVLHLPLAPGDCVLLVCPQWSISEWHRTGDSDADPGDIRSHSLGSVVAIAGIFPAPDALDSLPDPSVPTALLGVPGGASVRVTSSKVSIGDAAALHKRAARESDSVTAQLDAAAVAQIVAPPGGGPCTLARGTVTLTGQITSGSNSTEVAD